MILSKIIYIYIIFLDIVYIYIYIYIHNLMYYVLLKIIKQQKYRFFFYFIIFTGSESHQDQISKRYKQLCCSPITQGHSETHTMTNTCTSSSKISVCVCEVTLSDLQNTGDGVYDWALQTYVAVEKLIKDKPASKKVSLALLTLTFTFMRLPDAFIQCHLHRIQGLHSLHLGIKPTASTV